MRRANQRDGYALLNARPPLSSSSRSPAIYAHARRHRRRADVDTTAQSPAPYPLSGDRGGVRRRDRLHPARKVFRKLPVQALANLLRGSLGPRSKKRLSVAHSESRRDLVAGLEVSRRCRSLSLGDAQCGVKPNRWADTEPPRHRDRHRDASSAWGAQARHRHPLRGKCQC